MISNPLFQTMFAAGWVRCPNSETRVYPGSAGMIGLPTSRHEGVHVEGDSIVIRNWHRQEVERFASFEELTVWLSQYGERTFAMPAYSAGED